MKSLVRRIRGAVGRRFASPRRVSLREALNAGSLVGKGPGRWTTAATSAGSRAATLPQLKAVTTKDEWLNARHALFTQDDLVIELRGNECQPAHLAAAATHAPMIIPEGIWIAEDWQGNYYHWLVRHLPKLMLFERAGIDCPLLLPQGCGARAMIEDTLDHLGWTRERRLYVDAPVTLMQQGHVCQLADPDPELVREVAARLRLPPPAGARGAVFVSRGAASSRRIIDEQLLADQLSAIGVQTMRFEGLSFEQQRQTMSSVTTLIGMHGAGLANMMLMAPGSSVVEIMANTGGGPTLYEVLAKCLGHAYALVPATPQNPADRNSDVHVDNARVVQDVNRLHNAARRAPPN